MFFILQWSICTLVSPVKYRLDERIEVGEQQKDAKSAVNMHAWRAKWAFSCEMKTRKMHLSMKHIELKVAKVTYGCRLKAHFFNIFHNYSM